MKSLFPRRVAVGLLILFLMGVRPAAGEEITQLADIKGGKITRLRPCKDDAIAVGEPFYFTMQVATVKSQKASIREITVKGYLCVRDVSSGALMNSYFGGGTVSGSSEFINAGDTKAQWLSEGREYPAGEYEIIAFVMVNTDKALPIVVDVATCRFRVKGK